MQPDDSGQKYACVAPFLSKKEKLWNLHFLYSVIEIFTTAIQALCIAFSSFSRLCFPIYFALYSVYIFTFAVSISFPSLTNNLAA